MLTVNGMGFDTGSRRARRTTMLLASAATMFLSTAAFGQEAEPASESHGIDDIVVTARKRTENVQNVPISVSVVTAEQIRQQGAADFRALDGYVPNMVQIGLDSNISPLISIRGIGSDSRNTGFESGVSVYIDGVYQGRPTAWMSSLNGIDRFEVLRGPQGTLFGKNTIAGAISITTEKPGNTLMGSADLEYGNYDLFRARGSISGPLVPDRLAAGISGFVTKRDGFQHNLADGRSYGNKNDFGGRAQLRFTPTEQLEISIAGDYLNERVRSPVNSLVSPAGGPFGVPAGSGPRDISINEPAYVHRKVGGVSATIGYELGNGGTITSITALRWDDVEFLADEDLTASTSFPRLSSHFDDRESQFTQELRYASASDKRLRYVAGLFFYDQSVTSKRDSLSPPGGFGGLNPTTTVGPVLNAKTKTQDYAAYVQANYDITNHLELTVGGRYTSTRKKLDFVLSGLPAFGIISIPQSRYKQSDDAFSPMASLLFKATDSINLYATVSRGFKGGGFNADFVSNPNLAFNAESATTYEVGFKSFLLDRRLRFNTSVFHTDYSNLQVSSLSPLGGFIIDNAGTANIDGGEVELEALPWTGMTLNGGLGYTDAKFSDYGPNPAYDGNRVLNSPEWTVNAIANQKFELGALGSIAVRGEYNYRSDYFIGLANAPTDRIAGYGLFNARLTYTMANGRYSLQGWVENIGDKLYVIDRGRPIGGAFGQSSVVYGKPRTYGIRASARF